jgi:hypothetical protein
VIEIKCLHYIHMFERKECRYIVKAIEGGWSLFYKIYITKP